MEYGEGSWGQLLYYTSLRYSIYPSGREFVKISCEEYRFHPEVTRTSNPETRTSGW